MHENSIFLLWIAAKSLGIIFILFLPAPHGCGAISSHSSGFMAYNVPAVYDVLAARIRACVARPGPTKCGGGLPWE
jgi:hypothetical protein